MTMITRDNVRAGMIVKSSHGYKILVTETIDPLPPATERQDYSMDGISNSDVDNQNRNYRERHIEIKGHLHADPANVIVNERYPANSKIELLEDTVPSKITVHINDTPSGRLLARAITIMDKQGLDLNEAMDRARAEAELAPRLPVGSHVYVLLEEPGTGSGVGAIEGFVLTTDRYEADVVIVPSEENLATARAILPDTGGNLDALLDGSIYVMRHVYTETLEAFEDMK